MSEQGPGGQPELVPGSQVAGYRLEERIGYGGMAVVFSAYDYRLDRLVALKVLTPALAGDEAFRRRFIRESRAAAAVDDPHIIPIFEAGESDGALFIAMRYVRGGDVGSLVRRSGPLPAERAAEVISQVASALDAAHRRGLVHRDVKPANMLLDERHDTDRPDHVYLSDFGLSKAWLAMSGSTAAGQFLGTLDYVAPEQIEGTQVDGRSDQYALACAAFELLSGKPPFRRDDGVAVMYAHLHEPPPPLRQSGVPANVDAVLARALAKTPDARYGSCGEFSAALRQAISIEAQSSQAQPFEAQPFEAPASEATALAASSPASGGIGSSGPERPTEPYAASVTSLAQRRPVRRLMLPAGIAVVVLAAAGAGFALASHGGGTGHRAGLALPGCSTATAPAPALTGITSATAAIVGGPFGVAVTHDDRYTFVTTGQAIELFRNTTRLAPTPLRAIPAQGAGQGAEITHDGKFLLAAAGSGAVVINVAAAESGAAHPIAGTLTSPGGSGAVEVGISSNDQFAFVTLQGSSEMAVFRLQAALTHGFGPSDFVGDVPLGTHPAGIASGGRFLYVTSLGGTVSVVSLQQAETKPASAVIAAVRAGCGPARALLSANAKVLWVTARQSDALLAFSTVKLRNDPSQALLGEVKVGEEPLGEIFVEGGRRIVVADSNPQAPKSAGASLAVVDTARALAGRPALLGYVSTGLLPRQFAVEPGGRILLVTDQVSHQLQALRISDLP